MRLHCKGGGLPISDIAERRPCSSSEMNVRYSLLFFENDEVKHVRTKFQMFVVLLSSSSSVLFVPPIEKSLKLGCEKGQDKQEES